MITARAYATVSGPSATFTTPDGRTESLEVAPNEDVRQIIVARAAEEARRVGADVELVTAGDHGDHRLLVTPTGDIASASDLPIGGRPESIGADDALSNGPVTSLPAPVHASSLSEATRRESFIAPRRSIEPATSGWRGILASLGITVKPSATELARREREQLVSRQWAGCRSVAVVNGKGGVGKTMTTAMLAAVYARHGGGNVLAWDNNDTRGTLGWRTERGLYDTTVRDLLPAAPRLLDPAASVSDISQFVHHQSVDRYDVLRSNPELLATDQRIESSEFDLLMQVAARYYRLVIFDSGNDESADRWLRMTDSSYQLVIPTLAAPESAESAALLLDALRGRDERSAGLADDAVVVVTTPEPTRRIEVDRIVDGFAGRVRHVAIIPFDPALKSGPLRFDALRPATRDAWVRVAAHTASNLSVERGRT